MNELVVIPEEVKELSLKVSDEKQNEVKEILNQIFTGTSDWEKQIDAIEVKDINDTMSIQMADTARKNAKNARLSAEKIFDAKRDELKIKMSEDKLEDSLWLKSKQIMQLKFKHIEEKAQYKADFVKRYEAEQLKLRNDLRYQKTIAFIPDEEISMLEISAMSDDTFNTYLIGIEKQYNDRIAAEKKAEEERIEKERIETLGIKRKEELIPFWNHINNDYTQKLGELSEKEFNTILVEAKDKKAAYDSEQDRIRKENERLQKEAEEKEAKRIADEKSRNEKLKKERETYEAKLKTEREAKEKIEREEKAKREKLEAELKAKKDAELKAKEAEELRLQTELNKGDQDKINDLIDELNKIKDSYSFKSKKNQKTFSEVRYLIDKVVNHIKSK